MSHHERSWALGLESLLPYDGVGSRGIAECVLLRAARRVQPFEAFAAGSGCLPRDVGSAYGVIRLWRQQAVMGANYILWQRGLQASLGVQTGAAFYERQTLQISHGARSSPSLNVVGTVGPELRLLVPAQGSLIQAGLVLGVDCFASSLKIGYVVPGADLYQTARTHLVQPYAGFGLALRF